MPSSMSVTSANVRNLNESRAQALQALQSVSERLGDILGGTEFSGDGTRRNETGDLVNEEGLPIIDITEPVDDLDTPSLSAATEDYEVIEEDNYPEPISKLTSEALTVSRKHRDKILDLLEQEEARDERKTRQELRLEMKRKREAGRIEMEKRMLTQSLDLETRRQTKELEKKMAKALISGLGELETVKSKVPAARPDGKIKKVVTFAEPPSSKSEAISNTKQQNKIIWADVVPATPPAWKSRVVSTHTQPVKMEVVERTPSLQSSDFVSPLKTSEDTEPAKDSDDESDLGFSSDSIVLESEDEDVVLSSQRHRELALEYHRRREALTSSTGILKLENDVLLDDQGHDSTKWNKEEVPLDATLAHPCPKPRISKFKASFFHRNDGQMPTPQTQTTVLPSSPRESSSSARSATFASSVFPTSSFSKSIKLGKLVDGQLVASPHDEDVIDREEREEDEIHELLLKSTEEYSGVAAQVMGPAAGSYLVNSAPAEISSSSRNPPLASTSRTKLKASRFKINRTQSRAPSGPEVSASSHQRETFVSTSLTSNEVETPSTNCPFSKPVSSAEGSFHNLMLDSLHQNHTDTATSPPSIALLSENRLLSSTSNHCLSLMAPTHTITIDSPSFMPPSSPNTIESPALRGFMGSARVPPTIIQTPSNHPSERKAAMVENVREKSTDHNSPVSNASDMKSQRISRFKADRSIDA